MNKIAIIDSYITRCENCTKESAEKLVNEIIAVFSKEIEGVTTNLDSYTLSIEKYYNPNVIDYFGDVKLLKAKLINYKANIELEFERTKKSEKSLVTVNQSTTVSISVNLEQTITLIETIPDEKLSQDEKEQLEGKLAKLSTEKDKIKLWEKSQNILKWIADKGIEVGIAALPYIVEALKSAK